MKEFIVTYSNGNSGPPQHEILSALNEGDAIHKIESKVGILIPSFEKVKSDILNIKDRDRILEYVKDTFRYSRNSIPIVDDLLEDADVYNYEYFLDETEHYIKEEVHLKNWSIDLFAKGIVHYLKHLYNDAEYVMKEAGFERGVSNSYQYDSLAIRHVSEKIEKNNGNN